MNHKWSYYKPWVLLVLFVIGWWVLPVGIKSCLRLGVCTFQAPLWIANSYLRDIQEYWVMRNHSKVELVEAVRDLCRERAMCEVMVEQAHCIQGQLETLEKMLNLPEEPGYRYEVARVIQRDINQWWQQLTIRKGSRQGVFVGAGVVFGGGVVGRVVEVFPSVAIVQLLTSSDFRIAAHFDDDARPVVYQGMINMPLGNVEGGVRQIPLDLGASIDKPRHLVTSRLGGVFPDGMNIGWVYRVEPGLDGLFAVGKVVLDERLMHVQEVAVLIPEEEGMDHG